MVGNVYFLSSMEGRIAEQVVFFAGFSFYAIDRGAAVPVDTGNYGQNGILYINNLAFFIKRVREGAYRAKSGKKCEKAGEGTEQIEHKMESGGKRAHR